MEELTKIFSRTTNSNQFIKEIDGLRFFSIITVILFHLNTAYLRALGHDLSDWVSTVGSKSLLDAGWWMIRLDLGVKVFFTISGFILAIPFIKQTYLDGTPVKYGSYLYRRLTRLEPPFVLSLALLFVGQVLILGEDLADLLPHFLPGLLYSHVILFGIPNPINPVTWSLETEAQFYLLLPLLIYVLRLVSSTTIRLVIIVVLIGFSVYFRGFALSSGQNHLSSSVLAYFVNFATGILLAAAFFRFQAFINNGRHFIYDFLGILAIVGLFVFYKPQAYWLNNILFNISVAGLFLGVFKGTLFNWFFTLPIVYIIGGMCYSLYLLHYALIHVLLKFTSIIQFGMGYWMDYLLQLVLLFPIVLVISSIFYLIIEKPCMDKDWPSKLLAYFRARL